MGQGQNFLGVSRFNFNVDFFFLSYISHHFMFITFYKVILPRHSFSSFPRNTCREFDSERDSPGIRSQSQKHLWSCAFRTAPTIVLFPPRFQRTHWNSPTQDPLMSSFSQCSDRLGGTYLSSINSCKEYLHRPKTTIQI